MSRDLGPLEKYGSASSAEIDYVPVVGAQLLQLLPWALLVALMFLPENKNRHAWLVFLVPVGSIGILNLIVRFTDVLANTPFLLMAQPLMLGLVVLWVLGERLALKSALRSLATLLSLFGVILAGALLCLPITPEARLVSIESCLFVLVAVVLLGSLAAAGRLFGRRFTRVGLPLGSVAITGVIWTAAAFWFVTYMELAARFGSLFAPEVLELLLGSATFACACVLPPALLTAFSPFYLARFRRVLRMEKKAETMPTEPSAAPEPIEA